ALNLVYWGTVVPHKGPHLILDALREANGLPVNLLIIGQIPAGGTVRQYLENLRQKAAAIPNLTLRVYGPFQRDELPVLLTDMDCVIVPSLVAEAGPLVPREALALGIPVVVSQRGALPEVVLPGENGFTFDPSRPHELRRILQRLATEEGLLPRLREGARRTHVLTVAEHTQALR